MLFYTWEEVASIFCWRTPSDCLLLELCTWGLSMKILWVPIIHGNGHLGIESIYGYTGKLKHKNSTWNAALKYLFMGLPWWSQVQRGEKHPPGNAGDVRDGGLIPGLRRSSGGGQWQPTPAFWPRESPRAGQPDGLQCIGSQRVGHDWATNTFTFWWSSGWYFVLLPMQGAQVQPLVWELDPICLS